MLCIVCFFMNMVYVCSVFCIWYRLLFVKVRIAFCVLYIVLVDCTVYFVFDRSYNVVRGLCLRMVVQVVYFVARMVSHAFV